MLEPAETRIYLFQGPGIWVRAAWWCVYADLGLAEATGDTYFLPARILHNETRVSEDYSVVQVYGPVNAATEQLTPEIIQ